MPTKLKTYSMEEETLQKLEWLMQNTLHKSKSSLINSLIEEEYFRTKISQIGD